MLIEMTVANFRSFHEEQTFTLAKGKGGEMMDTNTFSTAAPNNIGLLRSAAIYGPNASGKSNLFLALQAMKRVVLESAINLQRGDKLPVTPFRLTPEARQSPSEFEVTFLVDGVRYQYGFTATTDRIHEEWLLAYPKGRSQRWFSRAWNPTEQHYDWDLGSNLTGEKQLWVKSTRDNSLFLSTAVQLNSEQLRPVFDWFQKTLRLANVGAWGPGFSASLCESSDKKKIMDFLHAADLHIDDILVETKPFDLDALPEDMPGSLRDVIAEDLKGKKVIDIKTVHKDSQGHDVTFDFSDESEGTQKLFSFAGPWIDSLTNGYVLFIDELHDNLHPSLVQFLVQLFHDNETNNNNAQLVFTTHETSILNQNVFRRDQIWFCEKDKSQSTMLYPLTDFSPRKGRENLEAAYLSGRYGALPFTRSLKQVG
ncbi:RloA protein [Ectothiorhodospira haloalkaliphila]|uniref:RloA protein n=1 Tax=Ectothiorhodospira haloalkaliphila TaxID=421628 RepID=W8KLK1_9GAMM|nr:ATP-binding protein [Ectothiorhodospira haloalkaliphila]AHK77857.1 RloA protein [Ectothiorhodospira haloalkaliphila]